MYPYAVAAGLEGHERLEIRIHYRPCLRPERRSRGALCMYVDYDIAIEIRVGRSSSSSDDQQSLGIRQT